MSIAGRTMLINASLSNTVVYHILYIFYPRLKIDKIRRTFFWQGGGTKKKYHLIKWIRICKNRGKKKVA